MIDPKALEELDLASRAIERARVLLAGGPVRSEEEDNSSAAGAGPFGLLPCPFCGDEAYVDGNEETKFFVGCKGCYCNVGEAYDRSAMPEHMFMSAEEAVAAWNRRAGKDAAGEHAGLTQASDSLARPWTGACRYCPANFRTRWELEEHERIHSPSPAVREAPLREALEKAACKALDDWADDLAHTRDQYIDAHTSGTFNGRRINPKQARAFAHDFGERSAAVADCVSIVRAALSHPSLPDGGKP